MTKLITSSCVMRLVEKGLISLDTDVRPLIPELASVQILRGFEDEKPILEDNDKAITVKMLLTHTLGLGTDMTDPDLVRWSKVIGRTDGYLDWSRKGLNTPLKFAPGEGWYYGGATDWAGLVLENVTGETLGAYVQREILDTLGMKHTGFWPEKIDAERVPPTTRVNGKIEMRGTQPPAEHEYESGGSGLFTTAADYALFLQAFLRGDVVSLDIVKPQLDETQRTMLEYIAYSFGIQDAFAPEFPKNLPISHSLCGVVNLEDSPGKRRAGSVMWSGSGNSRWWVDPTSGVAAVMMTSLEPQGDKAVVRLYDQLERAVYSA